MRLKEMGLAKALETTAPNKGDADLESRESGDLDIDALRASYRRIRDELKDIRAQL